MATLAIFVNAMALIVFLQANSDQLLRAVVDPLHPDWTGMERAFAGFTLYAVSVLGVAAIVGLLVVRGIVRRARTLHEPASPGSWMRAIPVAGLAGALTAVVVLVLIEVLLFKDYGVHLYEFDVLGILADAALRRDLGIQPAEVARVTAAAVTLLAAELLLCAAAMRLVRWRNGALARACGAAMLVTAPGGLMLFRVSEQNIASDRAEFEGALPLGKQLLLRRTSRPHIAVEPRLGPDGYPVLGTSDVAPTLAKKSNIVFFVADGLRGDMMKPELAPNLLRFGVRSDVIHSRRHFSTGHVSEAGIFGLLYGLNGHAFHSFIASRVPSFPLEVLKRNGYHTLLLASSRLSPYPSDQLIQGFDEVAYPTNDDELLDLMARYIAARRTDHRPYFILAFFYTPHYPFTSAKPHLRKYPSVGPKARTNYMNDVLQADDYFRQTFELVREDFEGGRTVVLATADHGEEIRDHGVFGHASATFWNEKIVVPFFLGLPNATLSRSARSPSMSAHVDTWPTVFEHLGITPRVEASRFSDGRSLLDTAGTSPPAYVAGRFFPHADRPNVLVDDARKYWFRVAGVEPGDRLCVEVTRVTDLEDKKVDADPALDVAAVPAFARLQSNFWRFVKHEPGSAASRPANCTKLLPSSSGASTWNGASTF